MAGNVPFVDAHIHLWDLARIRYAWLSPPFSEDGPNGDVSAIARTYLPEAYRADLAGWNLAGAVHVDAGADPAQAIDETRWLEALAAQTGIPTAIVAYAALEAAEVDAALAAQAAFPHVRGIRQILNWHASPTRSYSSVDLTRDERWRAGFARLGAHGLSFDLQCYPQQMPALASLTERHPGTPVVVNHLGMPVLSDPDGIADWRAGLRALAAHPQVAIKLSGFGFVRRDWSIETILPLVRETIDMFGIDRCMAATDTPTDTLFAPLSATGALFEAIAADLSPDDRRNLFGRNANRLYRMGLDI